MWLMDSKKHILGYWPDGSQAGPSCPPEKEVVLEIQPNGNYTGGPEPKAFYEWCGECRQNPDVFTLENFKETFGKTV
jgi:hypothetical protein